MAMSCFRKVLVRVSLSVLIGLPVLGQEVVPKPKPSTRVPVMLEWEEIPGAAIYELEFQNLQGKRIGLVKSKSHVFNFKFKVGSYKVRSRVADARKVFGEWSVLQEFAVQPRPVQVSEKTVKTKGVLDPKTLKAPVVWKWAQALGALAFRVKIFNEKGEVVHEGLVSEPYLKMELPVGVYTTVISSVGPDNIESDPVTLPGEIKIEAIQLEKPILSFEEPKDPLHSDEKHLPRTEGAPTLRLQTKSSSEVQTVGTLEYRYFFGDEWMLVDKFKTSMLEDVVLKKAIKPGRYRLSAWSEATGFKNSEVVIHEFVTKPENYDE